MKRHDLMLFLKQESDANSISFEVEGISFLLEVIEEDEAVLLSSEMGLIQDVDVQTMVLREMLEANHAFAGTNGASLSIDPDSSQATLQCVIWLEGLTQDGFVARLTNFVDAVKMWKEKLSHLSDALSEEPHLPSPWPMEDGLILV